jgi:hypothetical protein
MEWDQKANQLFIEIKQNEIYQQKRDYEKDVKMNELALFI